MQRRSRFVSITTVVQDPEADYVTDTPVRPYGTSDNAKRVRGGSSPMAIPFEDGVFYRPFSIRHVTGMISTFPPPLLIKDVETVVLADPEQETEDPMDDPRDLVLGSSLRFGGHRQGQDASQAYADESRLANYTLRALLPPMASPSIFPVMFCTVGTCERRAVTWQVSKIPYRTAFGLFAHCLAHLPLPYDQLLDVVGDVDRKNPVRRCHPLGLQTHQDLRRTTQGRAYRHSPPAAFLGPVERSRLVYSLIQQRRRNPIEERISA